MLVCAATNRLYWTPRLPAPKAFAGIVRLASIEIALGLGIMLAVGALGTLAPPFHTHAETGDGGAGSFHPADQQDQRGHRICCGIHAG
jgi:hypothetical protein